MAKLKAVVEISKRVRAVCFPSNAATRATTSSGHTHSAQGRGQCRSAAVAAAVAVVPLLVAVAVPMPAPMVVHRIVLVGV